MKRLVLLLLTGVVLCQDAVAGENFSGKELRMRDFSGRVLEKANFSDAKCFLVKFRNCKLAGANFSEADLTSASFVEADCTGADFRGTILKYAHFQTTILAKANFEGLDLMNQSWLYCDMRGTNLKNTKNHVDFLKADLRGADLRGANLLGAKNIETAKLKGAKYDKFTRWPIAFDHESSGAVLVASDPEAKQANAEPSRAQPKAGANTTPDVKTPEGAPPVALVKTQLEKTLWAPSMQGGTKHTYVYKTIRFDPMQKRTFAQQGNSLKPIDVPTYPVTIVVEITRTFTDGSSRQEVKNQSFYFYKEDPNTWTYRFVQNN